MSGAARRNDPFNFDDIYRQAGVEDLFVKKTLGELKQKPSSTGPGPAAASPNVTKNPAPKSSSNTTAFDLDFLSTFAPPGGTPQSLSKHRSATNIAASAIGQQARPLQQPAVLRKPHDDPFALFEEVPGAAPVQPHAPPSAPPSHQASGLGNLLDFEDGSAFAPDAGPAPVAIVAAPSAPSRPLIEPQVAASQFSRPSANQLPSPSQTQSRPQQPPVAGSLHPPRPPDYEFHADHPPAPPGLPPQAYDAAPPPYTTTTTGEVHAGFRQSETLSRLSRDSSGPGGPSLHPSDNSQTYHSLQSHPYPQYPSPPRQQPYQYPPDETQEPSNTSSSLSWNHSPSGSGISGVLKAFGKKAVRAAKAGLAQLEAALEGLDHQQHEPGAEAHGGGHPGPGGVTATSGRSYGDEAEVSPDEALAWAVRLSDMPPHMQQQQLAHMPGPLRRKVIEVLREQVRSEYQAAQTQPPPAPQAPLPTSYAHGSSLPNAARGLAQGYGHGSPMPPPYPGATISGNSQDGSSRRGSVTTLGQERPQVVPAVPATATAPTPVAQPPAATELHEMGHGQSVPTGPPPEAVEDLLGLSDAPANARRPPPVPAQHPQLVSHSSKTLPSDNVPSPAPPPSPPAAVHVDDMDDFFSGGSSRPASVTTISTAPTGAPASSLARAASSSQAKSSGAASAGRVLGGSTTASGVGLADMLHDSDDDGVDVANVDVSGYRDLYKGEQGSADEPELRRQLRAQREAAKHAKMKAALAEKQALEAEEAARRQEQVALKDQYKTTVEAWKNKHKGNIRGLLGSLHTVLWPDSGWAPVTVADLLEPAQIKKVYMRANLLVHPDKVRQRNGSAEQVAIADMVFDVLKEGWNAFR